MALIALVAGCGNDTSGPQLGKQFLGRVAQLGKPKAPAPTADQLRAAVTPELRAKNGNRPMMLVQSLRLKNIASLVTQLGQNGDVRTYVTPDQISLSLRQGVLVSTRGFGYDLLSADVADVLDRLRTGHGRAIRIHRYLDGENREVLRSYVCDFETVGAGQVTERCTGKDNSFVNTYWLDGYGNVAASEQWVSPFLQSYRFEDLG